jgi:hypothetical protein
MTNNSSPAPYVISASSNYTSLDPFHAFDTGLGAGQYWLTNSTSNGWLKIDMGSGNTYVVSQYEIQVNTVPENNRAPKDWTLKGSNNDADWDTLDTVTGETGWTSGEKREFICDVNDTAYRYFKLDITDNNGDAYLQIAELFLYECEEAVTFTFTDPSPLHLSTVYGNSQTLQLTVTVSGQDPIYTYDATFYNATTSGIIGSTVSGTSSGQYVSTNWSTVDSGDYSWYVYATSSGANDTSSTYEFTKKYKCEGYVEIDGTRASGIPVRLYLRSDGELVGYTTSTGISGTFEIETIYNENHYAIAIHPTDSGTNALIMDWLAP